MRHLTLLLIPLLSGCNFGFVSVDPVQSTNAVQIQRTLAAQLVATKVDMVADAGPVAARVCRGVSETLRSKNGVAVGASSDLTITLSAQNGGRFYSNAACTADVTQVEIKKGQSSTHLFFKSGSLQSAGGDDVRVTSTTTYFPTTSGSAAGFISVLRVVNSIPTAQDANAGTSEETAVTFQLSASDENGDALVFRLYSPPGHVDAGNLAGLLSTSGIVNYIPSANFNGLDSFQYYVSDGFTNSAIQTVRINVGSVNDAPVSFDGSLAVNEDTVGGGQLFANDVDSPSLTYSIVTPPQHGSIQNFNASNGTYNYLGNSNYFGSDSFQFKASDGSLYSNIATVTVTVYPVNDAPLSQNGSLTVNEDTTGGGTLIATDLDSLSLSYSIYANALHGTVVITNTSTGTYQYTPYSNYNGSDTFTFRAYDGFFYSNIATVSITVNAVNDAPIAQNGSLTTTEDSNGNGTLVANDIDSASLTYSLSASAQHGTVTILNPNLGTYQYVPQANYNGSDSFSFRAYDGTLYSNVAAVSITVNPVNDAPVAQNGSITVSEDNSGTGFVVATDLDSSPLYYLVDASPSHGTVNINYWTGAFTYTPAANYYGSDSFQFHANDGSLNSNTATVSITINPVNDAPVATNKSAEILMNSSVTLDLTGTDIDSPPAGFSYQVSNPQNGSVSMSGALMTYTPAVGFTGLETLTYTISDNFVPPAFSNTATITIDVGDGILRRVNNGPLNLNNQSWKLITSNHLKSRVWGIPGASIVFTVLQPPQHGEIRLNGVPTSTFTQVDVDGGKVAYVQFQPVDDGFDYRADYSSQSVTPSTFIIYK